MKDISVEIDRLVVEGAPGDARRLGRLIEAALETQLRERGVPAGLTGGAVEEVRAPAASLPPGATDRQLARQTAQAVYHSLGRKA